MNFLIKIFILLRNFLVVAARMLCMAFGFIWRCIPSGGSLFGIPGELVKVFCAILLLLAFLNSCAQKCNRRLQNCPRGQGEQGHERVMVAEAEPVSGRTRYYGAGDPVAPFRVTASGCSCLLELVDENTSKVVVDVFVKDGRTEDVRVPAGTFEIRYAAGQKWHGGEAPFGPGTSYSKRPGQKAHFEKGSGVSLTVGR